MSTPPANQIDQMRKAQGQPVEYVVFSGGGAKGAGYSGVHGALEDSGILTGVKAVAGSSAGSISAAVIASGISKEDFEKLSQNTNMKGLLGEEGFLINKDGKPLLNLVADTVQNNVSSYLGSIDIQQVVEQRLQQVRREQEVLAKNSDKLPTKELAEKSAELQKQAARLEHLSSNNAEELYSLKQKSDTVGKITFGDLDLLRAINPEKFKGLVVTATRKDNGELIIFDAEHSPNIEIADACRASSSIPIVFKPHTIDGVEYVDGGYRDNIPLKYFGGKEFKRDNNLGVEDISGDATKIEEAKKQGRTMSFAFGGDMQDPANIAIYSAKEKIVEPGKIMTFLMDVVFKTLSRVGGKFKYSQEQNELHERVRENALNTVVLDTGEVGTLSFDKAQEKAQYLHIKGYLQTMDHMNNHELGSTIDQTLGHKNFILGVYEESLKQSTFQSWKNKIIGSHEEKTQGILNLCKDESWQNKSPQQVLSDLVVTAATQRTDGALSPTTNTMTKLIDKLNDPATPNKIVADFVEILKIDKNNDPRFDKNKTPSANLLNFKFDAKDFSAFLSKEQENIKGNNEKKNTEPAVKSHSEKHKVQGDGKKADIHKKKEGSKADLAKESIANSEGRKIGK